ncbi:MAG: SpoIIE family protein phosphatase [Candidatus Krumholzibacteria bacterium]|nr:SpoIIE family protein phosphatase [Candidatus Krumholzibacteria bacterium]
MDSEIQQVLQVLSKAIIRETAAFNYYYKGSEDASFPPGVRGLLSRLAEEERMHRHLLMNEYIAVEKGWQGAPSEGKGHDLSYAVPDEPVYVSLDVSSDLEVTAVSLPARLVGGDNILSTVIRDHNGKETGTFLLLYDVMGHSIETTEINALAARVLGEYLEASCSVKMEKELVSPQKVVQHLNEKISEKFEGQGVFLTLLCALFDSENKMMTYTLAGHEPPFLVNDRGSVGSLLNTQLIVGIDAGFRYLEHKVPFREGDLLCIFSDGIVEAENAAGEIYGRERVAGIMEKFWEMPSEAIVRSMLSDLREFCWGMPLKDEVSIVIVGAKGVKNG